MTPWRSGRSQMGVAREVLETMGVSPEEVAAIGITNQRETTIVWDKATGKPVYNAIVWQCRRTAPHLRRTQGQGPRAYVKRTPAWSWTPTSPAPR